MRTIRTLIALALIASAASLTACFGGGADVQQHISTVSKGQELVDLKRALDEGAIDQRQYEQLRTAIMRRPD